VTGIPDYPRWRVLTCHDKPVLDRLCVTFAPYAEATLATLFVWNDINECSISTLNSNILIRHHSCGGGPVVSLLGNTDAVRTARILVTEENEPLRLVPNYALESTLESSWAAVGLQVIPDRDNDDYVFETSRLAVLAGGDLKRRRKLRNAFSRTYQPSFDELDLACPTVARAIRLCANVWFEQVGRHQEVPPVAELRGLEYLLGLLGGGELRGLLGFGVRAKDDLVAFSIVETHGCEMVSGVVFKASRDLGGAAEFLRSSSAARLLDLGYTRINIQQDLGSAGLRRMKSSYRPETMLRKWTIANVGNGLDADL
jgi:uncharacterized protein